MYFPFIGSPIWPSRCGDEKFTGSDGQIRKAHLKFRINWAKYPALLSSKFEINDDLHLFSRLHLSELLDKVHAISNVVHFINCLIKRGIWE